MNIKIDSEILFKASQDQIFGEGCFADLNSQATYNEHILPLCYTEALNAWNQIQELGNSTESYINVIQGPRELLSDILQRLTKGVQIGVADS